MSTSTSGYRCAACQRTARTKTVRQAPTASNRTPATAISSTTGRSTSPARTAPVTMAAFVRASFLVPVLVPVLMAKPPFPPHGTTWLRAERLRRVDPRRAEGAIATRRTAMQCCLDVSRDRNPGRAAAHWTRLDTGQEGGWHASPSLSPRPATRSGGIGASAHPRSVASSAEPWPRVGPACPRRRRKHLLTGAARTAAAGHLP